jgi:hypothetical protein
LYVVKTVSQEGAIGYVFERTLSGKPYLDFPIYLSESKTWKTLDGATKAKEKFLTQNYLAKNLVEVSVEEVSEEDIEKDKVQSQERLLFERLEREKKLSFSIDSIIEKPMKLRLFESLAFLKPGEKVRYYVSEQFKLVEIKSVSGKILMTDNGYSFSRIDGTPENKSPGRVLPDDEDLCNYILSMELIRRIKWGDVLAEKVIQIASILKNEHD